MFELTLSSGTKILVAQEDLEITMSWTEAQNHSTSMTDGWRLPTTVELVWMFKELHLNGQGSFHETGYWSSAQFSEYEARLIIFNKFSTGSGTIAKQHKARIRLVRTVSA